MKSSYLLFTESNESTHAIQKCHHSKGIFVAEMFQEEENA